MSQVLKTRDEPVNCMNPREDDGVIIEQSNPSPADPK